MGKKKRIPGNSVLLSIAAFVVVIAGAMASVAILTPFLLALFVSIISIQPVLWLSEKGVNNTLSVVIVLVLIIGLFVSLGAVLGNSVNSFAQDAPIYAKKLREMGGGVVAALQARGINLTFNTWDGNLDPARIMNYTANVLTEFGAIMSNAFLIFFIVLFMLLERASIRMKAEIIATSYNNNLTVMTTIINGIRSYLGWKTVISLLTGIFIWLWLLVFGIEYALLWGLIAFLLNYIPNIGSIIAGVPAVLFALVQLGFGAAGWTFLGYVLVNTIVGNVVEPRVMGKEMGLSTLIVFLSLIFWGFVLGTVGMFLAVPLTMTFKIILDQYPKTKWLSILLGSDEHAIEMDRVGQSEELDNKGSDDK